MKLNNLTEGMLIVETRKQDKILYYYIISILKPKP